MRRRPHGDEGAASAFVIGMVIALLVVAGLVVDGGRALNARVAAADVAEQAARAGATRIDTGLLRSSGAVVLDQAEGRAAAAAFLTAHGYDATDATVTSDATTIRVSVRDDVPTTLLQLIFITTLPVSGEASARAALGIVEEIPIPGGP